MKIDFSIKNGILYGPIPDGLEMNLDYAKMLVKARIEFLNGRMCPAVIDTTGLKSITKDARDYMASVEASEGIKAAAILSRSVFSTFLSNFFIKISLIKAPMPVRLFTDAKEADAWLQQFT